MSQQARQMVWYLEEHKPALRFLIHDNDGTFAPAFAHGFEGVGVHGIPTPFQAPNAYAYAERWVRTGREAGLDRLFIVSEAPLRRVLREDGDYSTQARPHHGLQQQTPIPFPETAADGLIHCRDVLGGIGHAYHRRAA